ncbi:DUF6928 family protein [Streptomyces sp. NPDC048521]|uniref:DUF6928 family protein n=1 Tax=Streptomyces sp. NPDC048521 TaxID=3365566 RepID=UPI00371651A6
MVARVRPGQNIERDGEEPWASAEAVYPPEETVCALSVPGLYLVCDREFMIDRPSQLSEHLVSSSRGRRLYLHAMHSVVDWLAFAIREDGRLLRSLSLSPDTGIIEDMGERLAFELPYWEGRHPMAPCPSDGDEEPYPRPFHPLDLGERAMLEFFGFYVEGSCAGDEAADPVVDAWGVELHGFRVTRAS